MFFERGDMPIFISSRFHVPTFSMVHSSAEKVLKALFVHRVISLSLHSMKAFKLLGLNVSYFLRRILNCDRQIIYLLCNTFMLRLLWYYDCCVNRTRLENCFVTP